MSAESLLELNKLALTASCFEDAVRPTLVYLVGGVPAIGAVLLERVANAGSEPQVKTAFEAVGALTLARAPGTSWLFPPSAGQPNATPEHIHLHGYTFAPRVTFGPAPSTQLSQAMLAALYSPRAPLVALSQNGQAFSLALEREAGGIPSSLLGLYTFQPYGLPPEAEERFLTVAEGVAPLLSHLLLERRLQEQREELYRLLGTSLEQRGADPVGHTEQVAALSVRLGKALGMDPETLQALRWGAYLHDVGKLGLPDSLLLKRGKLELFEWQMMYLHPQDGLRFLLERHTLPQVTQNIILEHHEHWDGSGYPHGLSGDAISLEARIFALVDAFDALTSPRFYREPMTQLEALEELSVRSYGHFDPAVVEAFVDLFE
jgi:putative nucleotidyltransferase with HDIG domain